MTHLPPDVPEPRSHSHAHAIAYASLGIVVAPMWPGLKALHASRSNPDRAILGASFDLATVGSTDQAVIASWYDRSPDAGVAVVCGARSGMFVVDVDPRNGGDAAWELWSAERADEGLVVPDCLPLVSTPRGGFQLWVRLPPGTDVRGMTLGIPGVDVLGSEHWAGAPPSSVDGVGQYEWTRPGQLVEVPWLLGLLRSRRRSRAGQTMPGDAGTEAAPFDLSRGLNGEVPPGEQHDYLVAAAASLRARRTDRRTALALLESVVSRFENGDPDNAWDPAAEALEVWAWAEDLPEGIGGEASIVRGFNPVVIPGGAGGTGGEGELGTEDVERVVAGEDLELRSTDYANAMDLVRLAGHRLRWTPQRGWYRWRPEEGRWALDEGVQTHGDVIDLVSVLRSRLPGLGEDDREIVQRRLGRLESLGGLKACLEVAQHLLEVEDTSFDAWPELLNCANGVVNLLTGELLEHDPAMLLTRRAPTVYDPSAVSPLLEGVLNRLLPDPEIRTCLLELLGGALVGGNRARLLVIVHGPTTTGKTTLFGLVAAALGDYAGAASPAVFRGAMEDRPRPDLLRLLPRRIAVLEEAGSSWELHADTVKMLTGGAPLLARAMHSNRYLERVPDFTPFIVTNEVPRVKGADDAIRRRFVAVRMAERLMPGEEDPGLRARLEADEGVRRAALRLLVSAAVQVHGRVEDGGGGGFPRLPQKVVEQTAEALAQVDDVMEFVGELVEDGRLIWHVEWADPGSGGRGVVGGWSSCVRTSDLHDTYTTWVKKRGDAVSRRDMLGARNFAVRLEAEGWVRRVSNGSRWLGWELRGEHEGDARWSWRPER